MKIITIQIIIIVILILSPKINFAQGPNLGTASSFALFTSVGAINNFGMTSTTIITGNIGTNVGAFNVFPPGTLIGQKHVADATSAQAAIDVAALYSNLFGRTCGSSHGVGLGSGETLGPNIYCLGAASTLTGNLNLDGGGNSNAIFIFQINGALATASSSNITLINSASLCNVFWQVNGEVDLGAGSVFKGNIVANGAINLLAGATLQGRALTQAGAVNLYNNTVTIGLPPTASTITAGGPITFCYGGNVILSGNIGGTWSNGATTPSITVTASGDYFVTNTTLCGSVTSNHIIVTVGPCGIPTMSEWGLIILGFLFLTIGTIYILRLRGTSV